jgi:hypothetical protein
MPVTIEDFILILNRHRSGASVLIYMYMSVKHCPNTGQSKVGLQLRVHFSQASN